MRFQVATLCDFANVRDGMLSLLSAGVTRLWRTQFPAEINAVLALMIEIDSSDVTIPKELRIRIEGGDGELFAEASAVFQGETPGAHIDPGEPVTLPLVMNLHGFSIPKPGRYQIVVDPCDGTEAIALGFRADHPPIAA